MPVNKKMVRCLAGRTLKSWEVDLWAMQTAVPWANEHPELAEQEVAEMELHFPLFIATIASRNRAINCARCGEILVWKDGVRCVGCEAAFVPRQASQLCYIGQIPSLIGELDQNGSFVRGKCRPFFRKFYPKLRKPSDSLKRYFFTVGPGGEAGDNILHYFAPVVYGVYPDNWNRDMPTIILEEDYFKILGIQTEHVFPDSYAMGYKLCNYADWPRVTMRVTLQQRIVPRIIIDLMLSDLQASGKLREVLGRLGTTMHDVYNIIGRRSQLSEEFAREYQRSVIL